MNPKVKKAWIKALRSGVYVQGATRLVTTHKHPDVPDEFCCLGVLCDIAPVDILDWGLSKKTFRRCYTTIDVARWAGLSIQQQFSLALLNDSGYEFKYIANWIEENL